MSDNKFGLGKVARATVAFDVAAGDLVPCDGGVIVVAMEPAIAGNSFAVALEEEWIVKKEAGAGESWDSVFPVYFKAATGGGPGSVTKTPTASIVGISTLAAATGDATAVVKLWNSGIPIPLAT